MPQIKKVCVFCGSNRGALPVFAKAARELAQTLAQNKMTLVYGGANVGLMGELANTLLDLGGEVTGVIPKHLLEKEIAHKGLTELHVVDSLHERKALMAELADAFVLLPGGTGSLEEFFEILTWAQLGIHAKPAGILNVDHYFDKLIHFLQHTVAMEFVKPAHLNMIMVEKNSTALLKMFSTYVPTKEIKWIKNTADA